MQWRKPLEVVFLTNFSDACFRSIPWVAQMADDLSVDLTILHAYDSATSRRADVEASLHSFFPEADYYSRTTRVAMPGSPLEGLEKLSQSQGIDLVICPASDALGWPRLGHRSLRARIIHEKGLPVWTIGRHADVTKLKRPVKNVACWLDFGPQPPVHLNLATEYASAVGARLHLLHALPEMEEGLILPFDGNRPLHEDGVRRAFVSLLDHTPVNPEIHIAARDGRSERAKLIERCDADLLFAAADNFPLTDWIRSDIDRVDRYACPTICTSTQAPAREWRLLPGPVYSNYKARTA
jgi:hypothetical protein